MLINMVPNVLLFLLVAAMAAMAASPPKPVDVPFQKTMYPLGLLTISRTLMGGTRFSFLLTNGQGLASNPRVATCLDILVCR